MTAASTVVEDGGCERYWMHAGHLPEAGRNFFEDEVPGLVFNRLEGAVHGRLAWLKLRLGRRQVLTAGLALTLLGLPANSS